MEKFLKSIFSKEKKKGSFDENDVNDFAPPLDERRKLSISRSGRMRHANKKRHSLSNIYGQGIFQQVEKPKSVEYHVRNPQQITDTTKNTTRRISAEIDKDQTDNRLNRNGGKQLTPEEEIEGAFEIIEKVT